MTATTKRLQPPEQTDSGWIYKCPTCEMSFESGNMGGGSVITDAEAESDTRNRKRQRAQKEN